MIHHIFKIIWNERKSNGWILLEYTLVFCILWFCSEYLYHIGRSYIEPIGFNIENTYRIVVSAKNPEDVNKLTTEKRYERAQLLSRRILQYPGIEHMAISHAGLPYYGWFSYNGININEDSLVHSTRMRLVTKGFFDVFDLQLRKDLPFDWSIDVVDQETHPVIISPDRNGNFGPIPVEQVQNIRYINNVSVNIIDILNQKLKTSFFEPYEANFFSPISRDNINLWQNEITIRTNPRVGKNFPEQFIKEMREQLDLDPYFIASIAPMEELRADYIKNRISEQLNSTYAITAFLFFNIFLGVTGTFWYRTQSRRSEIGLRMAIGASRRNVKRMLCLETLLLLFIASLVATNICLQIGQTELFRIFDLPTVDRGQTGIGYLQDFLNYFTTFGILAIISLLAVWLPATQISAIQPSEALRDE